MKYLDFADGLRLPANEAAAQKYAFMGRSSSGKTYAAGKLVEELYKAKAQFVVIDPVGTWAGLRLAKDGKSPGMGVPVFGGSRGDIPLEPTAGAFIADLVVEKTLSIVLDVSEMIQAEQRRFVKDFATEFLQRKKTARSPVLFVWEEAQEFVPEFVPKDATHLAHAMQKLIKLGRNYGIGTALLTQRPQAVAKDVLNQCEALFVFQTSGKHERKAILDWVVSHDVDVGKMVDNLPSLRVGDGYVWSPQWLRVLEPFRVYEKQTYDLSATPTLTQKHREPAKLPSLDLAAIESAMAATIEKVKANDPVELKKRIQALEKQLASKPDPVEPSIVEVPVIKDGQLARLEKVSAQLSQAAELVSDVCKQTNEALRILKRPEPPIPPRSLPIIKPIRSAPAPSTDNGHAPILGNSGKRRILTALAQSTAGLTPTKLSILTGISQSGGTWRTYMGELKSLGYIVDDGQRLDITTQGSNALGAFAPLPTGRALLDYWRGRLGNSGKRRIFDALANAYPGALTPEALSAETGIATDGGTWRTYLGELRGLELVTGRHDLRLSDDLFE